MSEKAVQQLLSVLTIEQLNNSLQGTYDELVTFALSEPSDQQREAVVETAKIIEMLKEEIKSRG